MQVPQMIEGYQGRCMCGAVRFTFSGQPRFVADCVCQSCRHAHGASAVGWVGVQTPRFKITRGETKVHWYASSDTAERGFCMECGTRMFFRSTNWAGETHMALACMTEPHDLHSSGIGFKDEFPTWTALKPG